VGFLWVALWLPIAQDNPSAPIDCFPDDCSVEEMLEQQEVQSRPIDTNTLSNLVSGMQEKLDAVPWKDVFRYSVQCTVCGLL
jgi:hypothetical protein